MQVFIPVEATDLDDEDAEKTDNPLAELQVPDMNLLNHGLAELASVLFTVEGVDRKPVYNPTPRQAQACSDMAALIHGHVNSLLDLIVKSSSNVMVRCFGSRCQTADCVRVRVCASTFLCL